MMDNIKSRIKNYILQNVTVIWNPKNPHKIISFSTLGKKVDLLFWVLDHETKESYLKEVAKTFYSNAENIIDAEQNVIFNSTEHLAITFEKFVKKIGFLRFKDDKFWSGNKTCLGIKESSLISLYSRILDKRSSNDQSTLPIRLPVPLVQYYEMRRIFLDIIARDFNTTLDSVKNYTKKEIIQYSNFVLGCYLMVVEDNFDFFYRDGSKESGYINKMISGENFRPLLAKYVDLFCEKVVDAIKPNDSLINIGQIKPASADNNKDVSIQAKNTSENESLVNTITEVFKNEKNLVLLGDAGTGKSTSLLYLFYKCCLNVYRSISVRSQMPVFIRAHDYDPRNKFLDIIQADGQNDWIQEALNEGRIIFFIDGLNEIDENLKSIAYEELLSLMNDFSECRFILSSRTQVFINKFNIPCYRLQAFREYQIYDFLKKNVPISPGKLYHQIITSENLKELANNPLFIGIIASLYNSGNVPDCEGLLFDAFINSLLIHKNTLEPQIDLQSKVEVLSQVALRLKQSKKISCDMEEFRSITKGIFDSHSITFDIDSFIDEICRNLVIQISEKQNVSFYHESYLDYFSAKAILKTLRLQKEIFIDLTDVNWHKPIIICSDLALSENYSEDFSEFLFTGGLKNKLQKPLNSFTDSDFNEHLLIACKVAYNLRAVNPIVYMTAQRYVSNALVLWFKVFLQHNHEPIPLELLFGAVAALNSERLIRKILTEEKWLFLWVYDQKNEKNPLDTKGSDDSYSRVSKFYTLIREYTNNIPDFSLTYKILNEQLQSKETAFFSSINQNLTAFKHFLLHNVPIRFLIKYYKEEPNYEVLWRLLQRDLGFLNDSFESIVNSDDVIEKSFLFDIIKAHPTQVQAYKLIFGHIHLLEDYEHNLFDIIEFSLYHNEAAELLVSYFNQLLDRNCLLFSKLLFFIRKCSWNELPEKIQSFFKSNLQYEIKVKYKIDQIDLTLHKVFLTIDNFHEPTISNRINHKIWFNSKVECRIVGFTKRHRYKNVDLICSLPEILLHDKIAAKGVLTYIKDGIKYNPKYVFVELSLVSKTLTFSLDRKTHDKSSEFLDLHEGDKVICNNIPLTFVSRSIKTFPEQPYDLIVQIIGSDNIVTIPQKGEFVFFETFKTLINNSDYLLFHPEQFADTQFVRDIKKKLSDDSTLKFIEAVGISHLFTDKLKVRLGIINIVKNNVASVFCFESNSFIDILLPIGKKLSVEDIVVIEKDGNIFQATKEIDRQLIYDTGYIISIDELKHEGFIRNEDTTQDHFFSFRSCTSDQNIGDKVRFIKIKNKKPRYEGLSVAVKISKISEEQKTCVIESSQIDAFTNSIFGLSKDIESGQIFRFRISIKDCRKIRNLLGIPLKGKYFSYFLSRKSFEKTDYPKIRFIELIADEN